MLVRVEIVLLGGAAVVDLDHNVDIDIVAWIDIEYVMRNNIECRVMAQHVPK